MVFVVRPENVLYRYSLRSNVPVGSDIVAIRPTASAVGEFGMTRMLSHSVVLRISLISVIVML